MNNITSEKYNKFIYYPDLANKFLCSSMNNIQSPNKHYIYLSYIFSQRRNYNYIALKALMMLSSIFPKRCRMSSKLIVLQFSRLRCHSIIFFKLNLQEAAATLNLYIKNPVDISNAFTGYVNQARYFIFPGFIKHLRLPHWDRPLNISFNQHNILSSYPLFFHKTSFLD
jgi:hypothetical protein